MTEPDFRFMRLPEVMQLTGLRRSKIYDDMKAGTFPKAVKLSGRAIAWRSKDIAAWIESRG